MKDSELFELINFHPDDAGWTQQMYRRELGGQYGHKPASSWCQWAGGFLLAPSEDSDGVDVLLRLLALAETLYPGGMERTRLEESLSYLFEIQPFRLGRYPIVALGYIPIDAQFWRNKVGFQAGIAVIQSVRVGNTLPDNRRCKGIRCQVRVSVLKQSVIQCDGVINIAIWICRGTHCIAYC